MYEYTSDDKYCLCDSDNFEQTLNYASEEKSFNLLENKTKYFVEDVFEENIEKSVVYCYKLLIDTK